MKAKYYIPVLWIVLAGFLFSEIQAQESYVVIRGERPPIDLQSLPADAYEKGTIKIKLDESFAGQLDNDPVMLDNNGIVKFNITNIDALNLQFGVTNFKKVFESRAFSPEFSERHRAWGFHLWFSLGFDEKTDVITLVNAYNELAEVSVAEPAYKKQMYGPVPPGIIDEKDKTDNLPITNWTPNDPSYTEQWHYNNTGQQSGTPDADIDLPEAWDIEKGNSDVIVCVEDMGIQYDHPDLAGNMWSGLGYDFYNDDATIEPGFHGTHVAGTIAAESNNGVGVSGIAGGSGSNDGVRLMSCQVFTPAGNGGGFELAPVYAADNGACISQNSWGYTNPNVYDQSVLDAIDYFNENGGGDALLNGGLTIYAAGNNTSSANYYPGCYSGAFSVAATNNQDILPYYSNYGTWVEISAPGGEQSYTNDPKGVYSTYTGSSYSFLQGTSMACPHVSGVAALIISHAYGEFTPDNVANILLNTTDDHYGVNPGYIGQLGTGRLNANQALIAAQTFFTSPPVANFSASNTNPSIGQTVVFTDLSFNLTTSWLWSFSPNTVTFVGGTSTTSQDPQVQFNEEGSYDVVLTATNSFGSDPETKVGYINVSPFAYCTPTYTTGTGLGDYITLVQLGDINNATGASTSPFYTYYSALSTDLIQGENYTITLSPGSYGSGNYLAVWIDYSHDGTFSETTEKLGSILINAAAPATGTINFMVPADAVIGTTRMRVREVYNNSNFNACSSYTYGETEDYNVNILAPEIRLNLTAFLEGPFNGTGMEVSLQSLIPPNQPFNSAPWNYSGTENFGTLPNSNVVDWVLIDVRDVATALQAISSTSVAKQAALILNDGSIVDLDGSSDLAIPANINQNLFVVVWQRNHLGVMSNNALVQSGGIYTYDFSTGVDQVYGGIDGHKQLATDLWGMFSGDGDRNGTIESGDKSTLWDNESGSAGYINTDYNLDGQSNNIDKDDYWLPNTGNGTQVPN